MNNCIHIDHLCIGYRMGRGQKRVVAEGLTATLVAGKLTCLLGCNGTGKSTLLRTLAGLQPPLSGRISFGQNRLPASFSKEVSVVLTEHPDLRNLSVSEVVGTGRMPYTNFWGTLTDEDHKAVAEAMGLVGISGMAGRDFGMLSDGERQKVMIAKALAQQTPIIILDEPTAFLDYPSKREVMALLHRLAHEQEKTILLSTHDVELAKLYADQIWFMDDSRLLTGTVHELNLEALF